MSRSFPRRALTLCVATATSLSLAAPAAHAAIVSDVHEHSAADASVKLSPIGTYESGVYEESAAEIVAFHPASQRILTVNARSGKIDVLDAAVPRGERSDHRLEEPRTADGTVEQSPAGRFAPAGGRAHASELQ